MWSELVENYMEVGSDYAAGVVEFGIKGKDLKQKKPWFICFMRRMLLSDGNGSARLYRTI